MQHLSSARAACILGDMKIDEIPLPSGSLIAPFAKKEAHYTDCFETPVSMPVILEAFIRAFYTQPLFKAERLVLRIAARQPSSDAEAHALAAGQSDRFAVWGVEGRTDRELLMADRSGRTMSWLMADAGHLRFGSIVVPERTKSGRLTLGPVFHSLLSAHKVYSRALLSGAARRVQMD
ncbi:DUF2867 domain-containing protein [Tateyamaria omphalii]|uniref:DUF2867 domain-containing protein n=1 Tax=Tateyamaria omphalii TaxID=299262 RepID=UPI001C992630|nr:DUF2867 domain-containing protein [Tateyamaria omphalii]MBY5932163.1 DUF2867 domain-containing protein [Tateyamaria omphalii]